MVSGGEGSTTKPGVGVPSGLGWSAGAGVTQLTRALPPGRRRLSGELVSERKEAKASPALPRYKPRAL